MLKTVKMDFQNYIETKGVFLCEKVIYASKVTVNAYI